MAAVGDDDWQSNLSSWKNRRKSHSSNQRLNDFTDEELNHEEELEPRPPARRKAKTFKEMLADKEKKLGSYASYSYDDEIITKPHSANSTSEQNVEEKRLHSPDVTSKIDSEQNDKSYIKSTGANKNEDTASKNSYSTSSSFNTRNGIGATKESNNLSPSESSILRSKSRETTPKKYSEKIIRISQRPNNERGFGFTIITSSLSGNSVLVDKVTRGSSADVNELKANDEILSVDNVEVSGKSLSSVQQLLDSAVVQGQIKLKIKRVIESGADDDIFEEDEFIMSQERRRKDRQSYNESELSSPPPTPPRLSISDYNDEPPPLPNLPPPPPNWNTFPEPSPTSTTGVSPSPVSKKLDFGNSAVEKSGEGKTEGLKEESVRKRFEFLGLSVENSEEYKRILEEKEDQKAGVGSEANPVLPEGKAAESAYIASITNKKDELPITTFRPAPKVSSFDPYEVYKLPDRAEDKSVATSAERSRLNIEHEDKETSSALRRPSEPQEPVLNKEQENKNDLDEEELRAANRQKMEDLRKEILMESRVSAKDTYVGNLRGYDDEDEKPSKPQPSPVKMNVRGTESLPRRDVEETFTNLQEAPWSKESAVGKVASRYEDLERDAGKSYPGHARVNSGDSTGKARGAGIFAPQPYSKPNHSRSSSSELLKSTSDFHQRQTSDLAPKSDRPSKKLAMPYDSSAKIIIGKHSATASEPKSNQNTSVRSSVESWEKPKQEKSTVESWEKPKPERSVVDSWEKSRVEQKHENQFAENTVHLPLSPNFQSTKFQDQAFRSNPVTQNVNRSNPNLGRAGEQNVYSKVEAFNKPMYSQNEPQYSSDYRSNNKYARSNSVEPIKKSNEIINRKDESPIKETTKQRTNSVSELPSGGGSNIGFLLYGDSNAVSASYGGKDPAKVQPSRQSLSNTYSSTAQLIDNYKRVAPSSDVNYGQPGTRTSYGESYNNNYRNGENPAGYRDLSNGNSSRTGTNIGDRTGINNGVKTVTKIDRNYNDNRNVNNRSSLSSDYNKNVPEIPLSSKVTVSADYNYINPYERFTYIAGNSDLQIPLNPTNSNIRVPTTSEYNSVQASDRFVNDLMQSRSYPPSARRPSESGIPRNSNRYEQPSYSIDQQKSKFNSSNAPESLRSTSYKNPQSYSDEFVPLQSRLVSDRPPQNGEPWSPGQVSPQRRENIPPGGSTWNAYVGALSSDGVPHWLVEEAERRRVSENTGKPRPVSLHRTITTEENPSIRIPSGQNSRGTLTRQTSKSASNIYNAGSSNEFRPNNYDIRRQGGANPPPQGGFTNSPPAIAFPSSPTFQWYNPSDPNKFRSTNPANGSMYVSGSSERARVAVQPSASYVASGAVDSLFSYMGSGEGGGREGQRENRNSVSGNLGAQRPLSHSQGNLYSQGTKYSATPSTYGQDYNSTRGRYETGLGYNQH